MVIACACACAIGYNMRVNNYPVMTARRCVDESEAVMGVLSKEETGGLGLWIKRFPSM